MGIYKIRKASPQINARARLSNVRVSGIPVVGGFMDSMAGGGWGPIVTTKLVGASQDPKEAIGSVNYAEFFLTISVAAALFSILDANVWVLFVGSVFTAPLQLMQQGTSKSEPCCFW